MVSLTFRILVLFLLKINFMLLLTTNLSRVFFIYIFFIVLICDIITYFCSLLNTSSNSSFVSVEIVYSDIQLIASRRITTCLFFCIILFNEGSLNQLSFFLTSLRLHLRLHWYIWIASIARHRFFKVCMALGY